METYGKFKLGNLTVSSSLMNSAGISKTVEDVGITSQEPIGIVMAGSYGLEKREGIENDGIEFMEKAIPQMKKITIDAGKELGISIIGNSIEEYARATKIAIDLGANLVEESFSYPNSEGRIITFDKNYLINIFIAIQKEIIGDRNIAAKFHFINNASYIQEIGELMSTIHSIKAVTVTTISPNDPEKRNRLELLKVWRNSLDKRIKIIISGGVKTPEDVLMYKNNYVDFIQVGRMYQVNPDIFKVLAEGTESSQALSA